MALRGEGQIQHRPRPTPAAGRTAGAVGQGRRRQLGGRRARHADPAPVERREVQRVVELRGGIHRVGPKFTGLAQNSQRWPSRLTGNPYESLRVDPDSGPTLWISGCGRAIGRPGHSPAALSARMEIHQAKYEAVQDKQNATAGAILIRESLRKAQDAAKQGPTAHAMGGRPAGPAPR